MPGHYIFFLIYLHSLFILKYNIFLNYKNIEYKNTFLIRDYKIGEAE